jgi:hypothetical protein
MAERCQSIMNVRGKGLTHIWIEGDAKIAPAKSSPQQSHTVIRITAISERLLPFLQREKKGTRCEAMGEMRDRRRRIVTAGPSPIPSLRDGPLSSPALAGEDDKRFQHKSLLPKAGHLSEFQSAPQSQTHTIICFNPIVNIRQRVGLNVRSLPACGRYRKCLSGRGLLPLRNWRAPNIALA